MAVGLYNPNMYATNVAATGLPATATQQRPVAAGPVPAAPATAQVTSVAPPTGLIGSEQAIQQGVTQAANAINQGSTTASQAIRDIDNVTDPLGGFANQGAAAFNNMAGLLGVGTPEQIQAAQASYTASPSYNYILGETQRATERSAAARGGLLGGNVARALQENAAGLASTDFQNQINNLSTLSQTGLGAATATAGIKADARNRLADIAQTTGLNLGSLYSGASSEMAAGRYQAGRDIAANATAAASSISKLLQDQGIQISDMLSKDISSITDLIYQSGMQDKIDNQNLAAILANISGGQASNVLKGQSSIGAAQAAGILGINKAIQGGVEQAISTGLIGG